MNSSFGDPDLNCEPLVEIETEDLYEEEDPLTIPYAESRNLSPSEVHLGVPDREQIKEEVVFKMECTEDEFSNENSDPSCDSQRDESSLDDLPSDKEETSTSTFTDLRLRRCAVVLNRISTLETDEMQEQRNSSTLAGLYECDLCSFKTDYSTSMKRHQMLHKGKKPFSCNICDYKAIQRRNLEIHQKKVHGSHQSDLSFKCRICNYRGPTKVDLEKHMNEHTDVKIFKCDHPKCQFKASQRTDMVAHVKKHADSKIYQCDVCDFKTTVCRDLVLHTKDLHSGAGLPFTCRICKYWAGDSQRLVIHMKKHKALIKCDQCEYTTHFKDTLNKHKRIHTGRPPLKCTQCPYRSTEYSNFYCHMRIHSGEKPYKCYKCDYQARNSSTLKAHMAKHNTPGFEKKCKLCDFTYVDQKSVDQHIMTQHPGEEKYTCEQCDYVTLRKSKMIDHKWLKHVEEKPFQCELCDESFSLSKTLKYHIKIAHPEFEKLQDEDPIETNECLMTSPRPKSPPMELPQTSMPRILDDGDSHEETVCTADTVAASSQIKSEEPDVSDAESNASDAGVIFL